MSTYINKQIWWLIGFHFLFEVPAFLLVNDNFNFLFACKPENFLFFCFPNYTVIEFEPFRVFIFFRSVNKGKIMTIVWRTAFMHDYREKTVIAFRITNRIGTSWGVGCYQKLNVLLRWVRDWRKNFWQLQFWFVEVVALYVYK